MPGKKPKRKPVSQAQRKAMRAAAGGRSTLGIPRKVGREYSKADPGGKLPKHKKAAKRKPARRARKRS